MDTIKIKYSTNFTNKEFFLRRIPKTDKHDILKYPEFIDEFQWDFFLQNKSFKLAKFFKRVKKLYGHKKINYIFNNNFKKIVFISRYNDISLLTDNNIIKIIFLLNKLKRNSYRYNYIFVKKKNPRGTPLPKVFDIFQNKLNKAVNNVKDKEYEDYLEMISPYVEKKLLTNNNANMMKLDRLIDAIPKPLDEGRKYYLDNMFYLKSTLINNMNIRTLSRDRSFFLRNLNLMFFHNILKLKKNLLIKIDNFTVKMFRKKYMYYYSMIFLEEKIIKVISPGILLKFFEIYEKHKKKNKKALRLMVKTLSRLYGKFNKKVFNKIFVIEFFDKGIIDTLSNIKNLSRQIDFIFINFKFCKEKRVFRKARLFKRNKVKKLLKINLNYIKSLNLKKRNKRYSNLLSK